MKSSRLISLLLLGALAAAQISCSDEGGRVSDDTTAPNTSDTTSGNVDTTVHDDLPDEDFGGYTFRILSSVRGQATLNAFPDEENGDTMNDIYYKRNQAVMSRFNVDFYESKEGDGLSNTFISQDVLAGDDAFDLYQVWDRIAFGVAQEDMLFSIDTMPEIDLSKPYWSSFNNRLSINGKLYFVTGDENPVLLTGLVALFFNKDMCDDLGIGRGTFYKEVDNGTWTVDRFFSYAKQAIKDADGNGKLDQNDTYGVSLTSNTFFVDFLTNSELYFIDKDKDDLPYLSIVGNERYADAYDKLISYCFTDERMLFNISKTPLSDTSSDVYTQTLMHFGDGQSLFAGGLMSRAGALRDYDTDFGIVPFPTFEEKSAGESYSGRTDSLVPYVVPKTNSDLHRTGVLLEALACEGHKVVVPTYYNVVLGQKETRDEDSIRMLDMMFSNRCVELEAILFASRRMEGLLSSGNENFASELASLEPGVNEKLTKLIEAMK